MSELRHLLVWLNFSPGKQARFTPPAVILNLKNSIQHIRKVLGPPFNPLTHISVSRRHIVGYSETGHSQCDRLSAAWRSAARWAWCSCRRVEDSGLLLWLGPQGSRARSEFVGASLEVVQISALQLRRWKDLLAWRLVLSSGLGRKCWILRKVVLSKTLPCRLEFYRLMFQDIKGYGTSGEGA